MELELKIEKLVFGGDGLGFVEKKACFVEGALPGERVVARVFAEKPNFLKAKLLRVLEPSPKRIIPPCPYVERCGGCQYQHLPYAEELKWKEAQVRESFDHAFGSGEIAVLPIRRGAKEYGYRNSITIHRATEKNNRPQRLGFIGRDNYSKVLIDHCMLADDRLRRIFTEEHPLSRNEEKRGFKLDEEGRIFSTDDERLYRIRIGGRSVWASSFGFFQNNIEVTELIAAKLKEYVAAIRPARFLDLYSGVGVFPLLAAKGIPEIHCFEDSLYSMGCLRRNAKEWDLPLAGIFTGRVEKTFPRFITQKPLANTLVFMDPPRQGVASSLANLLAKGDAGEHIFYLACDLQILLRDLRQILGQNRYQVREVVPFDMFPRTKHIEVLAWLAKR